jgi:uncharacterized protein
MLLPGDASTLSAMRDHHFNPRKLDVEAFAAQAARLEGEWPAHSLSRLADAAAPETPAADWPLIRWALTGEKREPRRSEVQIWLHLEATASVALTCQRCLQPVQEALNLSRWFQFVRDEDEAAALDVDSEDDVLALSRSFDAIELIEDELLLSLPLVPRHEVCPQPLPQPVDDLPASDADGEEERPHPFAALAALKKTGGPAQ